MLERGARQGYEGETAGLRGSTRVVWGLPGRLEGGPCRVKGGQMCRRNAEALVTHPLRQLAL